MLFSVITVCRNSAKTIRQTFDSVLEQDFRDYEYLVIDGVSTDGTLDIIREYEAKFQGRMRWVSGKDSGTYDAMNKGIGLAKGEYLNFLNSDDFYEPETLALLQKAILSSPGKDVYYGICRQIDADGREICVLRHNHQYLRMGRTINHQTIWYRRNVFSETGLFDTRCRICADYDHLLKLTEQHCTFQSVDSIVANYRMTGYSESNPWPMEKEHLQVMASHGLIPEEKVRKKIFRRKLRTFLDQIFPFLR